MKLEIIKNYVTNNPNSLRKEITEHFIKEFTKKEIGEYLESEFIRIYKVKDDSLKKQLNMSCFTTGYLNKNFINKLIKFNKVVPIQYYSYDDLTLKELKDYLYSEWCVSTYWTALEEND